MRWWATSGLFALAAALSPVYAGKPSAQIPSESASADTPAIAVLHRDGLLYPLVVWIHSDWTYLPWPERDASDNRASDLPPLPVSVAAIPHEWFKPLARLPMTWRAQLVNDSSRTVRLRTPAAWQTASSESFAIATDFRERRAETLLGVNDAVGTNAGIAVVGAVRVLPVRHLSGRSREWRDIVARHLNAFDRAQRLPWAGGHPRTRTALRRWLLRSIADLWKVERPEGAYFYFEVRDEKGAFEGRVETLSGRAPRVIHIQPASMFDGDLAEGFEVIGAVRYHGITRLVVESSGDDWQDYKLVDPYAPLTWRRF